LRSSQQNGALPLDHALTAFVPEDSKLPYIHAFYRHVAGAICLSWAVWFLPASAEVAAQNIRSVAASPSVDRTQRDREYEALARDVDALERELGIIKRVVK